MEEEDRVLAEDFANPVEIQPGVDHASPDDWQWRQIGSCQPSRATFHLSHSDANQVSIDVLRPSDCPPDAQFVLKREMPIIVMDSLDKYWAGESRKWLPLNGIRVPVEGDTLKEAKQALAADLSAQLRLLVLLSTSHQRSLAPQLRENLRLLTDILEVRTPQ